MMPSKYLHKELFAPLLFLLLSILILHPSQLLAAEIDSAGEQIDPSAILEVLSTSPSTAALTTIEVSGTWRNGCVPELDSIDLDADIGAGGGYLDIMAVAEPADLTCGQLETEWRFPIDVQFDLPGYYTVLFSVKSEQLETTELLAVEDFMVAGEITFTPSTPQLDESLLMTVTGVHHQGCVPQYVSHEIVDGSIVVELIAPGDLPCGQAITPWEADVEIAALDGGEYSVEIYKSYLYDNEVVDRTLYLTKTLSIGINAAQAIDHFVFLPSISWE